MSIRLANRTDVKAILNIYEPIVLYSHTSFELTPPDEDEMWNRIESVLQTKPWLVYEENENVLGYAYATTLRTRPAYNWSVEVSVYLAKNAEGKGIAYALYDLLLQRLKEQGYANAFGAIALPNDRSIKLHEKLGFRHVGTFENVGYKFGKWHSVGWWQNQLNEYKIPAELKLNHPNSTF